jgi:hypothetical protein
VKIIKKIFNTGSDKPLVKFYHGSDTGSDKPLVMFYHVSDTGSDKLLVKFYHVSDTGSDKPTKGLPQPVLLTW